MQDNEIKVPLYPKNNKCIGWGVSISTKPKGHEMKRFPAGFQKTMEIWLNYKILIDEKNHFFCSKCLYENEEIPFKFCNEINSEYILNILTKSFKKNKKKEKELKMGKKNPSIFFETLEDENILESSGISKKNLNEVSIILQHPI